MDRLLHLKLGDTVTVKEETLDADVALTVYHDERACATRGRHSPFVLLYVAGTAIERIGRRSDEELLSSMLERGYTVVVLDYLGNPRALCPMLERSVQSLRGRLEAGEFLSTEAFPRGACFDTLVVPAGCDVLTDSVFWSFDRHGTVGSLERIAEVWNNDFRGVKGERLVYWLDADGRRKPSAVAFDGSEPLWCDADGAPNDLGAYLRIKHTHARDVRDCVLPNGDPISLDLAMHIVYPADPDAPVPTMCLANSSPHLTQCAAVSDRPHLVGFALRGYATVLFDYGYVPMARADHYGYFDGDRAPGHVTGDNTTYSLQFYNDKLIQSAAIRYVRHLACASPHLPLDVDRIGVFGNSKGGWTAFLGETHPERIPQIRCFFGHHGETRFEVGDTVPRPGLRAGERQPWQDADGRELSSQASFVYASCGGTYENITEGHAPTFISCNQKDTWGSYYTSSSRLVAICRGADVRALWVDVPIGHTLVQGIDAQYGRDAYDDFFAFSDYYLKDAPISLLTLQDLRLRFSGDVPESEIRGIRLIHPDGHPIPYDCARSFGGVEWELIPKEGGSEQIYIEIPETLKGSNGKMLGKRIFEAVSVSAVKPNPCVKSKPLSERRIAMTSLDVGERAAVGQRNAKLLKLVGQRPLEIYPPTRYYENPVCFFTCSDVLRIGTLKPSDVGRCFRISLKVLDSTSRYLSVSLDSAANAEQGITDYRHTVTQCTTVPGEWMTVSFTYTIYEPLLGESACVPKTLSVSGFCRGDLREPISFKELSVIELT